MNVLLSVPMQRPPKAQVSINDNGLGSIAAAFRHSGADITLFSWNVSLDLNDFQKKLLEIKPDIFGLKVFTVNIHEVIATLQLVRKVLPDTMIIIGGPHPSMSKPKDLFADLDSLFDFAIAGDGECGVMELMKLINLEGGKPNPKALTNVPGLVYLDGENVIANEKCFDIAMDSLPMQDWELQKPDSFDRNVEAGIDEYVLDFQGIGKANSVSSRKAILYHDSRGCHARCGHCGSWLINGPNVRKRSLQAIYEELDLLIHTYGVRVIEFTGNELFHDLDYVKQLMTWLINLDVQIRWGCTGGPNALALLNEELLELMRKAGCTTIHYGVETGSPAVRLREHKPLPLSVIGKIVELAQSKGIKVEGGFMFGFTDETVEEMNETIKYAFSVPFSKLSFVICLPLPGTLGYEGVLNKYGMDRIDWINYDFDKPALLPTAATLNQVRRAFFKARLLRKFSFLAKIYRILNRKYIDQLRSSIQETPAVAI